MDAGEGLTYQLPLEVYLQGAVLRGVLVTNQHRLSNYLILRDDDEVVSLRAATLQNSDRQIVPVASDEYLIYLQAVFLIADLSPQLRAGTNASEGFYVQKNTSPILLNAGPYTLQGSIHTAPGDALNELLISRTRFIPVTGATLMDRPEIGPRTYLVNRTKIAFLTALKDHLTEL
jgi:hypothetical protein